MKVIYDTPIFKILEDDFEGHSVIRLDSPDWANVLAFNNKNELLFIRQYRHGTQETTLETPGGLIDERDKTPLDAAKRELFEETGYTSEKWEEMSHVYANPAFQNNRCFFFIARDIKKTGTPDPDLDERISDIFFSPLPEVYKMLKDGTITHSIIYANLATYFIKHELKM